MLRNLEEQDPALALRRLREELRTHREDKTYHGHIDRYQPAQNIPRHSHANDGSGGGSVDVTAHVAESDPHTGYLKESDFDDIDFLVGTATGHTAAEIVVGTAPGGELGGSWATPTVDTTHSGTAHHDPNHVLTAYKDTDQEVTDTTLASDSELTVTLALNGKYQFKFDLFFLNDGAAEGIKVSLAGTATVTDIKAQVSVYDDTLNSLVAFARITSLGGAGVGAGVSSGSNFASIEGAIEITTAGTFLLQFAQNATGASAGVHCEVGSSMVVTKLE